MHAREVYAEKIKLLLLHYPTADSITLKQSNYWTPDYAEHFYGGQFSLRDAIFTLNSGACRRSANTAITLNTLADRDSADTN
jgi:hypothetical protein